MIVSKRHRRPRLRTRVVRKIEEIDRTAWESVFPDIIESYDFYRALDASNFPQFSFRYILVLDRKVAIGATICFVMSYSLDTTISGPLRRISNAIKEKVPNIFSLKAVICGMPMGQGQIGVHGQAEAVVDEIVRRIERIAKRERAAIIAFKDFSGEYAKLLDPLRRNGFSRFNGLPTTELAVRYADFEEYLATLSSASRYDLRRKFRRVGTDVKIEMELHDSVAGADLDDVYRLYLEILDKHDMGFELLPREFFANIPRYMPGKTKYFIWRIEGKLVAFLFCLVSGDLIIDYYVGLDYSVAHKYHLYFVKFRDVLNWCIANGITRYEMGTTGYEPKRRLGFDFIPLYLYVKLRNRALRPVFKLLCQFLKFENFDPSLKKALEMGKSS